MFNSTAKLSVRLLRPESLASYADLDSVPSKSTKKTEWSSNLSKRGCFSADPDSIPPKSAKKTE
jgi:hypothetical protein